MRNTRWLTVAVVLIAMLSLVGCSNPAEEPPTQPTESGQPATDPSASPGQTEDATELKIEDLTVGDGPEAVAGKTVTVHYTGWLTDGTKFDSSVDSGKPYPFVLGAGEVIPGWDQGVSGMKVGGKRKLIIPPALGYGEQGAGGGVIPPNATLVFEVELLEVQ